MCHYVGFCKSGHIRISYKRYTGRITVLLALVKTTTITGSLHSPTDREVSALTFEGVDDNHIRRLILCTNSNTHT